MQVLDHVATGLGRLAQQYKNSPRFIAYLAAILALSNEVEGTLLSLYDLADIDNVRGVNLDTLGIIVGVSRNVPNVIQLTFFGWAGDPFTTGFGDEYDPTIGARWYEAGEEVAANTYLEDPEYRIVIRSKIAKNVSRGTCEDILAGLAYLFNTETSIVDVEDLGYMHVGIAIGKNLSPIEQALVTQLDLLPRPAGVKITQRITFDTSNHFGWADQANASGWDAAPFAEEF